MTLTAIANVLNLYTLPLLKPDNSQGSIGSSLLKEVDQGLIGTSVLKKEGGQGTLGPPVLESKEGGQGIIGTTSTLSKAKEDKKEFVSKVDFFNMLLTYAKSHRLKVEKGDKGEWGSIPWIDENLDPFTGDWISRTLLKNWKKKGEGPWPKSKGGKERGKDYNHSTFVDLIINGLIGIRSRSKFDSVVIYPLVPEGIWEYFCLDRILYHGRLLTVLWDVTGNQYHRGKGLRVFSDGILIASSDNLEKIKISNLPPPVKV
jgi:hypothetical protein